MSVGPTLGNAGREAKKRKNGVGGERERLSSLGATRRALKALAAALLGAPGSCARKPANNARKWSRARTRHSSSITKRHSAQTEPTWLLSLPIV
eukprot:8212924-Karenia_brevis.AAC.1